MLVGGPKEFARAQVVEEFNQPSVFKTTTLPLRPLCIQQEIYDANALGLSADRRFGC